MKKKVKTDMMNYPAFIGAVADTENRMKRQSRLVRTDRWQGVDISAKPEMAMHELLHHSFSVNVWSEDIKLLADDIGPNLPWADNHFEERVCGQPINPGTEWKNWPYGNSAKNFLDQNGQFNHNYMERYWPKNAGLFTDPSTDPKEYASRAYGLGGADPLQGIRYNYGDLGDVVDLLQRDPTTRQAFLPVWFPEDTGGGNGRAPCTLGYHFIMRDGKLDVTYYIRSCDFVRHFRDDIYLTVRLQLWLLDQLRGKNALWKDVRPGTFIMHITSLHMFRNDYQQMFGGS